MASQAQPKHVIEYLDYKKEIQLRMLHYHEHPDILSLFVTSFRQRTQPFLLAAKEAAPEFEHIFTSMVNSEEIPVTLREVRFKDIERIARAMNTCGYEFFESGFGTGLKAFYQYLPLKYQPELDELFESAFHRELETIQYCVDDFLDEAKLQLDEITALDFGEREVTLSVAEKIAQGLFMPAFELIRHEYILHAASKIREYNPHRIFHRLHNLSNEDKLKIISYIRYMIQADHVVTQGEVDFLDRVMSKLEISAEDTKEVKRQLTIPVELQELEPLSFALPEQVRRQVLGLVIDCAYADRMLKADEDRRILEIANLIVGRVQVQLEIPQTLQAWQAQD